MQQGQPPEEKHIEFAFHARYYKSGPVLSSTRQIWIVLHGYGQLARFFLKKFDDVTRENVVVIAPEGLARFYLSELTDLGRKDNRVGATWMTSENRLTDIRNYLTYLTTIYQTEVLPFQEIPVTLFGFSQGCATVSRWAASGEVKFDRLILWAGLFPPDMDFDQAHERLKNKEVIMVAGSGDPYLNDERLKEHAAIAHRLGIDSKPVFFEGKHELNSNLLNEFARKS